MPTISQRTPSSRLHKRFCENVRFWRTEKGLTQVEAARKCNMTQPQYCEVENGRFPPNLDTVERIARAFGVDPADLLASRERLSA